MTTASAHAIGRTCSEGRDPVESGADETEKPRSQPVELKVFPAPKRHCLSHSTSRHSDGNQPPRKTPLTQVIRSTALRYDPDEDYRMTSSPRGVCLIINNVNFELDYLSQRKGSDKDALKFRDIFRQFGFQVECKRDLTAEKMKNLFTCTAALCKPRHDALVVILLSHGTESGIYGTDGIEVDINEMLTYFDNKKCKQMMGKPKVFIVQACRGREADFGVRATQTFLSQPDSQGFTQPSQLSQLNPNTTKISRWSELDKEYCPTRTDMVLCFSCHLGFVSTRNEEDGSWLGASLAQNLQKGAHKKHLMEIFNMVSRDVRLRQSTDGHKQVLEITSIGFDRNLYFNPGLYDKNGEIKSFSWEAFLS